MSKVNPPGQKLPLTTAKKPTVDNHPATSGHDHPSKTVPVKKSTGDCHPVTSGHDHPTTVPVKKPTGDSHPATSGHDHHPTVVPPKKPTGDSHPATSGHDHHPTVVPPKKPTGDDHSIAHLIHEFFDTEHVDKHAKPLDVDDCLKCMMDFVKMQKLEGLFRLSEAHLMEHLREQAIKASKLPLKLRFFSSELAMPFALLGLYDLVVLVDDSASMEFVEGGKRKTALKDVLHFLACLYGTVTGRGIKAIRFLNDRSHHKKDRILEEKDVHDLINSHKFEGLTRIGAGLMRHILKPFVFEDDPSWVPGTPKKLRAMERPLLIMVITDGAVEGEPEGWVEKAVKSVVESLEENCIKHKGILFQFARVGNDAEAEKFLKYLDERSHVKNYVDTLSGGDLMDLMGARAGKGYSVNDLQKIMKLLLGPIIDSYDELANHLIEDLADVERDFM